MPVAAPFAAERLGDAVDRRLRGAIGGVAGRMAEQPARRRHQDDLAARALLEHLPAGGARHQPRLRDVGVHHVEEIFRLLVDDLRHLVDAGGDHEDVEAAERLHRGLDDPVAIGFRRRPHRHGLDLAAELARIRCATLSSAAAPPAEITTLAPAPASTFAAIAPNAPDAPVTMAVLPFTLNSDSGSFRIFVGHGLLLSTCSVTSPRLRGEAGCEAIRVRGPRERAVAESASPRPSPRKRRREPQRRLLRFTSPARPRPRWCRPRGRD